MSDTLSKRELATRFRNSEDQPERHYFEEWATSVNRTPIRHALGRNVANHLQWQHQWTPSSQSFVDEPAIEYGEIVERDWDAIICDWGHTPLARAVPTHRTYIYADTGSYSLPSMPEISALTSTIQPSSEEYSVTRVELIDLLKDLAQEWYQYKKFLSATDDILQHWALQTIISIGKMASMRKHVIQFILGELENDKYHWVWVLPDIANESPSQQRDTITVAAKAWRMWGKENGYSVTAVLS